MQLVVITTGLAAVIGGAGWQVAWLLVLAAVWLALGFPPGRADDDPGRGGGGGGQPHRPTPLPPTRTAMK